MEDGGQKPGVVDPLRTAQDISCFSVNRRKNISKMAYTLLAWEPYQHTSNIKLDPIQPF